MVTQLFFRVLEHQVIIIILGTLCKLLVQYEWKTVNEEIHFHQHSNQITINHKLFKNSHKRCIFILFVIDYCKLQVKRKIVGKKQVQSVMIILAMFSIVCTFRKFFSCFFDKYKTTEYSIKQKKAPAQHNIAQTSIAFKISVLGQLSLDPLKRAIMDKKVVAHNPILAGNWSGAMQTELAEATANIILGINVCMTSLDLSLLNKI